MKFSVSLKHIPVGGEVGRLENSGRVFACVVCRAVTGWRNNGDGTYPGVPCCSDECLDEMDEWSKENALSTSMSERISGSEPDLAGPQPAKDERQTHGRESDDEKEAAA